MATLDLEATTKLDRLRRALDVFEQIGPPEDCGVNLDAGMPTIPPSVSLFPKAHADHEGIFRRLALCDWTREQGWAWTKVQVHGVEVVLHDVRGAA